MNGNLLDAEFGRIRLFMAWHGLKWLFKPASWRFGYDDGGYKVRGLLLAGLEISVVRKP